MDNLDSIIINQPNGTCIKLVTCDCVAGLATIPSDSVDCVVTSPPYNKCTQNMNIGNQIWKGFKINYDNYADDLSESDYEKWMLSVLGELHRVLKKDGSVFFNHKVILKDCTAHFPKWIFESPFILYQMIVWNRMCSSNMRQETLYPSYELVFWLVKGKPNVYKKQAKYQNDVWNISPAKDNPHPAPFPYALVDNCIRLSVNKDTASSAIVLDPFSGSGTTALAARNMGCNFVGFELSHTYNQIAQKRLSDAPLGNGRIEQPTLF